MGGMIRTKNTFSARGSRAFRENPVLLPPVEVQGYFEVKYIYYSV
jgi:hypothetical protein